LNKNLERRESISKQMPVNCSFLEVNKRTRHLLIFNIHGKTEATLTSDNVNGTGETYQLGYYTSNIPKILMQIQLLTNRHHQVSGSGSVFGIRIQEDKNDPQKEKKNKKFHILKRWMFSFKG
jgi:hypothetical protein